MIYRDGGEATPEPSSDAIGYSYKYFVVVVEPGALEKQIFNTSPVRKVSINLLLQAGFVSSFSSDRVILSCYQSVWYKKKCFKGFTPVFIYDCTFLGYAPAKRHAHTLTEGG